MDDARRRAQDRLGEDVDSARVVRSGKERYGGLYGFFQQERFVIELELGESDDTTAAISGAPTPNSSAPTLESLLEETTDTVRVAGLDSDFSRELELVLADATTGAATTTLPSRPEAASERSKRRSDAGATIRPASPPPSAAPNRYLDIAPPRPHDGASSAPYLAIELSATPDDDDASDELVCRLRAAGLREEYLPARDGTDFGLLLARRLAELPSPPRPVTASGEVVVIIGSIRAAEEIAAGVAALSDSGGAVSVASHRRLPASLGYPRAHTPQEAGALVFEQRLEHSLSVVILDIECRDEFVAQTVVGLHPSTIWAVVPATWTTNEVEELATRCGRLDALALDGLLDAEQPAALIGGRWPIAFVDGWQAGPLTLAARLLESIGVAP